MPPQNDSELTGFYLGILGNLVATGLTFLLTHLSKAARRSGKTQAHVLGWGVTAILSTAGALFLALWIAASGRQLWIASAMAAVALTPLVLYIANWILRASAAGLVDVNSDTRGRVSPASLLADSADGFVFMGTGASKLTAEHESFEKAVLSATSAGKRVKLLLSHPDAANLRAAAQRAKKPEDEYRRLVLETLRLVKNLQQNRGADIEVRFYKGVREFRLFFVSNRYVVVSYNVYGTNADDSQPSLVLARNPTQETRSFYWAFKQYFDREWNAVTRNRWDFVEYL